MPESRITRQMLKDHFRRLWAVYLAGMIALIFLNHLVFTITRPSYSEDETLKIMLLNADIALQEEDLLVGAERLGFRAVELVELSVDPGDAISRSLLINQLMAGFGDIYITDEAGLSVLDDRGVCHAVKPAQDGLYLVAIRNGTDVQSAMAALEFLLEELGV